MGISDWFKKKGSQEEAIKLHSAGAIVRHKSPFEKLDSYKNTVEITQAFREEWVIPFYFERNNRTDDWVKHMISLKPRISDKVILQNLGDFNWRTRSTGAYFASLMNKTEFTEIIGTHLLKSEVCYAGHQYAITLASFNTPEGTDYLNTYLSYYLKQKELDFDQSSVMSAIKYLDELNSTNHIDKHLEAWEQFCQQRIRLYDGIIEKYSKEDSTGMVKAMQGHSNHWKQEVTSKPIAEAIEVIDKIRLGS